MSANVSFTQVWTKVTMDTISIIVNTIAALVKQYFGQRLAPQKTRVTKLLIRFWVLFTAHCSKNGTLEYIGIKNNSAFLNTQKMTMLGTAKNSY